MLNSLCLVAFGLIVDSPTAAMEHATFSEELLLIGVRMRVAPESSAVHCLSRDGKLGAEIYHSDTLAVRTARLDRSRRHLAIGASLDQSFQLWFLTPDGNEEHIADVGPEICAWSPDGNLIAYNDSRSSYQFDVSTKAIAPIELPKDYVIGDWHPKRDARLAVFLNPRNHVYREYRGDRYPTRQIDLIRSDGTTSDITKDPSSDNIWARFSPDGSRIAHYQRVILNEVPHEMLVVCDEDSNNPVTLLDLRKIGTANRLPWFRPKGHPVWSPDGKTIAWIVNTNERLTADGEKFEILFVDVATKQFDRISLDDKGVTWISGIEW